LARKNITWDNNLVVSAQTWSNHLANSGCTLQHFLSSYAQNLYAGYGWTTPEFNNAVNAWINEKTLLNVPDISFEAVGHYLIIVDSNVQSVGCATAINYPRKCFVITCDYD
jgi:hypothetical protein